MIRIPATGAGYMYILFYPELIDYLIENTGKYMDELARDEIGMIGMIKVKAHDKNWSGDGCIGAWEVKLSAVLDGFGPTMYDIVMGDSPNGLMADRQDVSEEAYDVWEFYSRNREDIQRKPLDWNKRQWTPATTDDCDWGSDSQVWQQYNNWDDDTYDYIEDDPSVKKGDFLSDPLNWVYNRGPVPNRDILRYNGEEADKRLKADGYWDDREWKRFGQAFWESISNY